MSEWVEWKDLPFPECRRLVLNRLARDLIILLREPEMATIVDEIVDFIEKRGWHKLDKLLPLVYLRGEFLRGAFVHQIGYLRHAADDLSASSLPLF